MPGHRGSHSCQSGGLGTRRARRAAPAQAPGRRASDPGEAWFKFNFKLPVNESRFGELRVRDSDQDQVRELA